MPEQIKKVAVLTDSNWDLPEAAAEGLPIFTVPLLIVQGDRVYRDRVEITAREVYDRQEKEHFTTSLSSPEDLTEILNAIKAEGYDQVIALLVSESLSGIANMLRILAEDRKDLEIAVINSKSASAGLGILVWQTAVYAQSGMPFEMLKQTVQQLTEDTYVFFSLDTLEYLQRGGRIGKATAVVGDLLSIKPILTLDQAGIVTVSAKVRGRKAAEKKLVDSVCHLQRQHPGRKFNLLLCDGDIPKQGASLEQALKDALPGYEQIVHGQLSATLAVHLGPNLLGAGIQFLPEEM